MILCGIFLGDISQICLPTHPFFYSFPYGTARFWNEDLKKTNMKKIMMPTKTIHISGIQAGKSPNDVKRAFQGAGLQVLLWHSLQYLSFTKSAMIDQSDCPHRLWSALVLQWRTKRKQLPMRRQAPLRWALACSAILRLVRVEINQFVLININSLSLNQPRMGWWGWHSMATLLEWGSPLPRTRSLCWGSNARRRRWSWLREIREQPSHPRTVHWNCCNLRNSCFDL